MTSNPSRHQIKTSLITNYPKIILRASVACLTIMVLTLTACSGKQEAEQKQYRDATEALSDYKSYLQKISSSKSATTKEIITLAKEWKELDDNIAKQFFEKAYTEEAGASDSIYINTRIACVDALGNLAEKEKRSLADYLDLVTALNEQRGDSITQELVKSVHQFYGKLDATPSYGVGNAETVVRYERTLQDALDKGLHSKQDVFAFLKAEDKAFRSFLEHLPTLGNIPLEKVRDNSSLVMKQIVDLAAEENGVFQPTEVVTILTMRNNRRLLQNALQCVNDIRSGMVSKGGQSAAYMWMLLQPWVSFDSYAFSMMSEAQMKTMQILAKETSGCIDKLGKPDFPFDIEELPSLLIRTFISTL